MDCFYCSCTKTFLSATLPRYILESPESSESSLLSISHFAVMLCHSPLFVIVHHCFEVIMSDSLLHPVTSVEFG